MEENKETKLPLKLVQCEYSWVHHAYLRFADINYIEENVNYASFASTGELPQLQDGHKLIPSKDIISYLKDIRDLDNNISPEDQLDSVPYIELINNSLVYLYLYKKWNLFNSSSMIPNFKYLSFPYSIYYSLSNLKKTIKDLNMRGYNDETDNHDKLYYYLKVFENKLDYEGFIYGDKPCILDAYLFGYVAMLFSSGLGLQTTIKRYDKLYAYFNRIMNTYFSVSRGEEISRNQWLEIAGLHIGTHVSSTKETLPYILPTGNTPIEDEEWIPQESKPSKDENSENPEETFGNKKQNYLFYLLAGGSFLTYLLFELSY